MRAITVHLSDEELTFVDATAARETRTRSVQIRHFIREEQRRTGKPGNGHLPWPPPLPPVDDLPALEAERDRLAAREGLTSTGFLAPDEQTRLGYLRNVCGALRRQVEVAARGKGVRA